jgi:periplasmic protein TonB
LDSEFNGIVKTLLAFVDAPRSRMAIALLLAAAICLALLAHAMTWLAGHAPDVKPHAQPPIDMQLVEIAPPAPALSAPSRTPPSPDAAAATVPRPALLTDGAPSRPRADTADTTPRRAAATSSTRADTPTSVRQPPVQAARSEARTMPALATSTASSKDAASSTSAEAQTASSASNTANADSAAASQETSASTPNSGTTQARLLSQPIPVLPDDLREQGYQLTAVAHFKIHADGSIDVELIKPTQNPRLNQILLETLHRWRFFPAMQNGHPVDSEQDVRVHFSVS